MRIRLETDYNRGPTPADILGMIPDSPFRLTDAWQLKDRRIQNDVRNQYTGTLEKYERLIEIKRDEFKAGGLESSDWRPGIVPGSFRYVGFERNFGVDSHYITVFGNESKEDRGGIRGQRLWEELAYWMLTKDCQSLTIDGYNATLSKEDLDRFLISYFEKIKVPDKEAPSNDERIKACEFAITNNLWPLRIGPEGTFYIPNWRRSGSYFDYLVANRVFRDGIKLIPERLTQLRVFEKDNYMFHYPLFSFLAKMIFRSATDPGALKEEKEVARSEFVSFLAQTADFIGEDDGIVFSTMVLKELSMQYMDPQEYQSITVDYTTMQLPIGTDEQRELLHEAWLPLATRYLEYKYARRSEVISSHLRGQAQEQLALGGWSSYFELIFQETRRKLKSAPVTLFHESVRTSILPILADAETKRKIEAAFVPILADIYGVADSLELTDIVIMMELTQIFISALMTIDDATDLHEARDNALPVYKRIGPANAIQSAIVTMLRSIGEIGRVHSSKHLGWCKDKFASMVADVQEYDLKAREICWNENVQKFEWDAVNFEANYDVAQDKIASVFSWFTHVTNMLVGLRHSNVAFEQFMNDIGYLFLFNNDLEDLLPATGKHEPGSDIGRKISHFWWYFMHLQLSDEDEYINDLSADKDMVKNAYNKLGKKRRMGEQLDPDEFLILNQVLEIGHKYFSKVVKVLDSKVNGIYQDALNNLDNAFRYLPGNDQGTLDERNTYYYELLRSYLDSIIQKIHSHEQEFSS